MTYKILCDKTSEPKTTKIMSPLVKGDHPEIDDSAFLTDKEIQQKSIIDRTASIGYISGEIWHHGCHHDDVIIQICTKSGLPWTSQANLWVCFQDETSGHLHLHWWARLFRYSRTEYYWEFSVYGGAKEEIPKDAPVPLGKPVITTTYIDTNLYHCMLTGKSVSGVLHLFNNTPTGWYASKKQWSAETATYGSKFVATRTATEQVIDNRLSLRYLGVPVKETFMFGDNKSVVNSSNIPTDMLHKWHIMLSWHRVREWIAAKILQFAHPGCHQPNWHAKQVSGLSADLDTATGIVVLPCWRKRRILRQILLCFCPGVTRFPYIDKWWRACASFKDRLEIWEYVTSLKIVGTYGVVNQPFTYTITRVPSTHYIWRTVTSGTLYSTKHYKVKV